MHRGKGDRKKGGGRMAEGRILNSKYKRRVTFALVSQKICCLQDARKPPPPLPPCTTRALESMHKAEVHSLSAHVPFTWLALFDLCFRHILKFDDVRLIRKKILVVWGDVQRYISLIYSHYSIDYFESIHLEESLDLSFWITNHIVGCIFLFFKTSFKNLVANNLQFSSVF